MRHHSNSTLRFLPAHALAACLVALLGAACGADEAAPSPCTIPDLSVDAGAPVSFRTDVMPILAFGCAGGRPCHNAADREADLFLGPKCLFNPETKGCDFATNAASARPEVQEELTEALANEVHADLVDVSSATFSPLARVLPGDPAGSFLIEKVTDTHNPAGRTGCEKQTSKSATGPCGDPMPPLGGALCTQPGGGDRVLLIARWIAQGAPNN